MKSILYDYTDNVVENIPSSLIACIIDGHEFRIQACSPEYIELRSSEQIRKPIVCLTLAYYQIKTGQYQDLIIKDGVTLLKELPISLVQEKELSFSCLREKTKCYVVETILHIESTAYRKLFEFVTKQYYDYIMLKSESTDNTFSQILTGYPAQQDDFFAQNFDSWRQERLVRKQIHELKDAVLASGTELVWNLDHVKAYQRYLESEIEQNDIYVNQCHRIYIGNQFCHNLFPERKILYAMLTKARKDNIKVTIATTYLRESLRIQAYEYLEEIYEWCQRNEFQVEVIVNDWGMFEFLKGKSQYMELVLGLLLNKRRKDPRYSYKAGVGTHLRQMSENQMNQPLFGELLCNLGIKRIEYETCGYQMKLADFPLLEGKGQVAVTLHLPMYQTNTSQFCTLYALCHNKDRGKQQLVTRCPRYCESYVCAYPDHLNMIGMYNSLFSLDMCLRTDQLQQYINHGVDRIVWNL